MLLLAITDPIPERGCQMLWEEVIGALFSITFRLEIPDPMASPAAWVERKAPALNSSYRPTLINYNQMLSVMALMIFATNIGTLIRPKKCHALSQRGFKQFFNSQEQVLNR